MIFVVGIPTKNEAATIQNVVHTMDAGLAEAFPDADLFIVNADSSSPDGTAGVFNDVDTRSKKISIATPSEGTGKGSNVFAIMHVAQELGADAMCLVDGDVRSMQKSWPKALLTSAMAQTGPTFTTPEYARSRYEANTTNQLVVPYLRASFGLDIRQPIGGEFAMNAELVNEALTWDRAESTNLYGIDVWLTVNTAIRGFNLNSVNIGRKLHNPTFPKIYRLGQEVLDTLFRLMMAHRPATPSMTPSVVQHDIRVDEHAVPLPQDVVAPVVARAADYVRANWDDLVYTFPALFATKCPARGGLPEIPTPVWCEILTDAYGQIDESNFRVVRDHLVGLFPARVLTYWKEVEKMKAIEVDELLEYQSSHVASLFAGRVLPATASRVVDPSLAGDTWRQQVPSADLTS